MSEVGTSWSTWSTFVPHLLCRGHKVLQPRLHIRTTWNFLNVLCPDHTQIIEIRISSEGLRNQSFVRLPKGCPCAAEVKNHQAKFLAFTSSSVQCCWLAELSPKDQ